MLFVANEPGRGARDAELKVEVPLEPSFLVELTARCFQRRLPGLDLAADREPGGEAPVLDEEDSPVVAREDRN